MKTAEEIYGDKSCICDYQPMLEEFGNILLQVDDDDYQGYSFLLYRNNEKYGYLHFGWGSCSGCDALQACSSIEEVQKLMDRLYGSIQWFDGVCELREWFFSHDWKGDYCWHLDSFHEFYNLVVMAITVINLPDGYEFQDENGNVIEAKKIMLKKKDGNDMDQNRRR